MKALLTLTLLIVISGCQGATPEVTGPNLAAGSDRGNPMKLVLDSAGTPFGIRLMGL